MAAKGNSTAANLVKRQEVSRPGVHAKTKTSRSKNSKNYRKCYKGQGR